RHGVGGVHEAVIELAARDAHLGLGGQLALPQGLVRLGAGGRNGPVELALLLLLDERDLVLQEQLTALPAARRQAAFEDLALEPEPDQELAAHEALLLDQISQIHGYSSEDSEVKGGGLQL